MEMSEKNIQVRSSSRLAQKHGRKRPREPTPSQHILGIVAERFRTMPRVTQTAKGVLSAPTSSLMYRSPPSESKNILLRSGRKTNVVKLRNDFDKLNSLVNAVLSEERLTRAILITNPANICEAIVVRKPQSDGTIITNNIETKRSKQKKELFIGPRKKRGRPKIVRPEKIVPSPAINKEVKMKYECVDCKEQFILKKDMFKHLHVHEIGKITYRCAKCRFTCHSRQMYDNHIKEKHKPPPDEYEDYFKCTKCKVKLKDLGEMVDHFNTHLKKKIDELYPCILCGVVYPNKITIQRHRLKHANYNPFKCTFCSYAATTNSSLQRHIRTHTGEKPFQCDQCDYKAARKSSLVEHIRIHTGEKPFSCNQCAFRSSRYKGLVAHKRIHSDERLFQCADCPKDFKLKSHLNSHIITAHKVMLIEKGRRRKESTVVNDEIES